MSLPPLHVGDGPVDGAHRLTVRVDTPAARWDEAARQLARDLEDATRAAAWDPGARLDLVGWTATSREARFFLAGSALHWVALATSRIDVPPLAHLPIALGASIEAWTLDRRALLAPTYAQITGGGWPFATDGPSVARRLELEGPAIGRAERDGLVALLRSALRREAWARGVLPRDEAPETDGEAIVLPAPGLRAGAVLEVVAVWTQLFWVDLACLRWTR